MEIVGIELKLLKLMKCEEGIRLCLGNCLEKNGVGGQWRLL
jgi:hypothetical protein